jgi:AdoMet-dependent heme synthase
MKFDLKWLAWEMTRRCNLACVHCRSSSTLEVDQHPDFSTEEAFRVLDDLATFAKPVIVLSGGEPLLRPDIFEIARYGNQKGFRMCLATNGTYITDELCEEIKRSNIKMVSLSLDGATAETHDAFRQQKGAFDATIRAAELFKAHGIPFLINSSFTKHNQKEIIHCFRLAKKLGAKAWYMFMVIPTGRGEEIIADLITPEEYDEILEWHYLMEQEEVDMLVRPTCAPHYYRVRFEENKKADTRVKSRPLTFSPGGSKGCLAGQTIALIDVDGNVLPCSYLPKSAGNVREKSFKTIWESSELLLNLRDFSSYKGRCGSCEYIKVCGGCRARAEMMKNDYMAEDPFCRYIPAQIKCRQTDEETSS